MQIVTKIRTDGLNRPYWSARIEHNGETLREIYSDTFMWNDKMRIWRLYRDTAMKTMEELEKMPDQPALRSLLMRDDEKRP